MNPARPWKQPARALALLVVAGACLGTSASFESTAAAAPLAQAPKPAVTPTPVRPAAPRAGGFPIELALPLLAGGGAAIGGGVLMLRRGRKA